MHDQKSDSQSKQRLVALSNFLKELRDEAIQGRGNSGIETIWREDDEYYNGIDDSNREERMLKPSSIDGRVTRQVKPKKHRGSSVFVNITSRYVNAAAAHVSDKLFPSDDSNYGIRPTSKPELIEQSVDTTQAIDQTGQPIYMPAMDENDNPREQPHFVNGQPMVDNATGKPVMVPKTKQATVGDMAKEVMKKAKKAAEKTKTQIDDWLNECGINGQSRQVVHDAARIGTGVLKGPFPEMSRQRAILTTPEGVKMVINENIVPKSRRINVENLWPDPSCGEDIHRGKYIFEDDEINARLLGELKKDPSYIAGAIDEVLKEGPKDPISGNLKRKKDWTNDTKELYRIWYFRGYLSGEDLEDCGYEFEKPEAEAGLVNAETPDITEWGSQVGYPDEEGATEEGLENTDEYELQNEKMRTQQLPVIAVMVNDTIIKATLSPFDSGRFPYQVMRWQYRAGHWAGVGVGRQMRTSQDGINAATRMMHDNAGASVAPIPVINRKMLVPSDGMSWRLGPGSAFYTTDDYEGDDIRKAVTWIITPSTQVECMNIIQFWMKSAEEETGLPMLLQGQQGNATDTKGGMQILNNNGNALLRRVTNIYDDDVTKPHIGGDYEWLLLHGEDDSMKGDFIIDARGSSVLIERDSHSRLLMQMLGASLNPAYGADPELVYKEFLLSQRFDAEKVLLSDEKKAEMAKRQPPPDPRIQVAQIKSEDLKNVTQAKLSHEDQQGQIETALRQWEKNLDAQIETMRMSSDNQMNSDDIKASLAKEAAKLRTQIALAMQANQNAPQVASPSFEPQGRAPNGQGFQK